MSGWPHGMTTVVCADVRPLAHPGISPEVLAAAAEHQRRLFQDACTARSGRVQLENTGVLRAEFARAGDALAAVVAAMEAYRQAAWGRRGLLAVRAAIQTMRDAAGADAASRRALTRASYLLESAGAGQVLLSASARDLARFCLPAGATLHDLGEQALRDLEPPERVYQLLHPALAAASPPPGTLSSYPTNLPVCSTPLVGRERELAELQALLATAPVVVLVGTAGVGKTRLALRLAGMLLPEYPDGCWLVSIDAVAKGPAVPQAVAAALELTLPAGTEAVPALVAALRARRLLVILDHCDPWLAESAALITALRAGCPDVRVVATCREPLRGPGGLLWPVPALSVGEHPSSSTGLEAYGEAVELFCARAQAALPAFALTGRSTLPAVQLCRRLDGLPLALELVAAWTPLVPIERLLALIDERLRPLQRTLRLEDRPSQFLRVRVTAGAPDPVVERELPPSREQMLRAILEWSYGQLAEPERLLLRRLGAFRGRFTAMEAQVMASGGRLAPDDVAVVLAELQARALVVREGMPSRLRYHLLPPVRQFARERLQATAEAGAILARCQAAS